MADDGWETVTDPLVIKKVLGQGAANQMAGVGGASPGGKMSGQRDKQAIANESKLRAALAVERQMRDLRAKYEKNFKGVGPGSLIEYLPTQARKSFDAASNGMRALLKPLVRGPGEGAFTDADQALLDSMIPNGGAYDSDNEQRFRNIEGLVQDARRGAGTLRQVTPTIKRIR
jgi:hypothetical protein